MSVEVRKVALPLRTSVELFRDPQSPSPEARAKFASLLFDEVLFEDGLYEVEILDGGQRNAWWQPSQHVTAEKLERTRHVHPPGSEYQLAMGAQPALGVPAPPEAMHVVMAGHITVHYVAEWISVLDAMRTVSPNWVKTYVSTDQALTPELRDEIRRARSSTPGDRAAGVDAGLVDWAWEALCHDATVTTSGLGAAFAVTTLFEPLLADDLTATTEGGMALDVVIPDISAVSWEAIAKFREHPAATDARARLRELEDRAREAGVDGPHDMFRRVAQEVSTELLHVVKETRVSVPEEIARQALTTSASLLVPVVGPIAGIAEATKDARRFDRSWYAALMHLNPNLK